MTDNKIRATCIVSSNQFYLALHAHNEENPNTIILRYNNEQSPPWTREDISTNVNALCQISATDMTALGNEGKVFFFSEDKAMSQEIIKGAGLDAPHAKGRGYIMDMTNAGGTLYAVGYNQQLFKRLGDDDWTLLNSDEFGENIGSGLLHFYLINGQSTESIYIFGESVPKRDSAKRGREHMAYVRALESGDEAAIAAAEKIYFAPLPEDEGCCFHWDGSEWEDVGVPEVVIEACFIESADKVWIGTADGLLLMGNAKDGFDEVGETDEGIVSICKFGERYILGTRDGLVEFIPYEESFHGETVPIKPNLGKKKGAPLPLKIQAFGDEMVYVDYNHGIYIWDGEDEWTHIPIPPEILERDFKGVK